ncbi:CBS domain-containing protein CBSX3, mitochondrial-like [Phragmites australis]|uniref:CBS domain-containing protein CBSX3, mitochondrial-like n=1 Tax=Phragmites australis TaxID=29695 RepID=UPI002D76596E|nr:CBS domain-containing protein CBSX3, mitochondrial-like [Phragmites australis]XP_062208502.1 CBS domain-containing protein CBSX3, mitochondrial-like [Phragmites australis]
MGLENITVSEILKAKGDAEAGAVYWCSTSHLVREAVKHMTVHNVGALVVLKSGDVKQPAGIVTERGQANYSVQQYQYSTCNGANDRQSYSTCSGF